MANFKIFIETGTDLSRKFILSQHRLRVMPLNLIIDGKEYRQDAEHPEMLTPVFYEKQRKGKLGEVAVLRIEQIIQCMRPVLAAGEDILYLSLDDFMGGNLKAARKAAEILKKEFPQRQVLVVDTACVSLGLGKLVELCNEYADGHTLEETYRFALEKAKVIHHLFLVDDPRYVRRFHQIGMVISWWDRMWGIRPIYEVAAEGYMRLKFAPRGKDKALNVLAERVLGGHREGKIYIAHADDLATAGKLRGLIIKKNSKLKIKIGDIGPAVGVRCGAGAVAVFYEGENRNAEDTDSRG
ncbi:MAG: DegV family EDD domain-containing protein [Clostridia bacterium]|nr:DegV family EDD domain-containing protein [Clostridia bacterium]